MSIAGNLAHANAMTPKYALQVLQVLQAAQAQSRETSGLEDADGYEYGIFGNLEWLKKES